MSDHDDTPTDRGGHGPIPELSPTEETLERFVSLVRDALHAEQAPLVKGLAAHQAGEEDYQRRVALHLQEIVEQGKSFGRRLTELEGRVEHIDNRVRALEMADTEPPDQAAE